MIILDIGSGTVFKNIPALFDKTIDQLAEIDQSIVLKWQLFEQQTVPYLQALNRTMFDYTYKRAHDYGMQMTASVFDAQSLRFLLTYDIPFIKIAANKKYWDLVLQIPEDKTVYMSANNTAEYDAHKDVGTVPMCCVAEYPAHSLSYERTFNPDNLAAAISDHTPGLYLYKRYRPTIWEKHFCIEHGKTDDKYGDAFCITVNELREVLGGRAVEVGNR